MLFKGWKNESLPPETSGFPKKNELEDRTPALFSTPTGPKCCKTSFWPSLDIIARRSVEKTSCASMIWMVSVGNSAGLRPNFTTIRFLVWMEAILHHQKDDFHGLCQPVFITGRSPSTGASFSAASALLPRHWVLGLEIYTDLTADMQPSIGPSMSRRKLGLEVSDLLICLVHRGSTHLKNAK